MMTRIESYRWSVLVGCGVLLLMFGFLDSSSAYAGDKRFAFLVANQDGWKGDPKLQYVISGDLKPLQQTLKRIGFEVVVVMNRDTATIRKKLAWLKRRLSRKPSISTLLFYYSGHAGKRYFHFGKRKRKPMSFLEFARFFRSLRVKRRFAIIDSCYSGQIIRKFGSIERYKKLQKEGSFKGAKAYHPMNIRKLMLPEQGKEEGLRIISSSLHLAWELHRYKASIFTYHLLKGLRNAADLNRDGKITIDELFDYASREVKRETGQRPQQLVMVQREAPYALAPAYYSKLWIGPKVLGHLEVRVGNFLWTRHKKKRYPLRVAVVDGVGDVLLRKESKCLTQRIRLPKGGEAKLSAQWQTTSCSQQKRIRKGDILLDMVPYDESDLAQKPWYPPAPDTFHQYVGVSLGYAQLGTPTPQPFAMNVNLHFRMGRPYGFQWPSDHRYFWTNRLAFRYGLDLDFPFRGGSLGLLTDSKPGENQEIWFGRLVGGGEIGLSMPMLFLGAWNFFPYAYVQFGGVLIERHKERPEIEFTWNVGVGAELSWWLFPTVGLKASGKLGLDVLFSRPSRKNPYYLHWSASLAVVFAM